MNREEVQMNILTEYDADKVFKAAQKKLHLAPLSKNPFIIYTRYGIIALLFAVFI